MSPGVSAESALAILKGIYRFSDDTAKKIINRAWHDGESVHGNPSGPGHIYITSLGNGRYSVARNSGKISGNRPGILAQPGRMDYNRVRRAKPVNSPNPYGKAIIMPPRGRRAAAAAPVEPEPEPAEETAGQFDHHLTKDLSPTMQDYGDWFHQNVADIDELGKTDPGRLLALGSTLYPHFQKSDLNQERRAARKSGRAAAADPESEPEPAPAPARGRRTVAAAPAATAPAKPRRGRAAAASTAAY